MGGACSRDTTDGATKLSDPAKNEESNQTANETGGTTALENPAGDEDKYHSKTACRDYGDHQEITDDHRNEHEELHKAHKEHLEKSGHGEKRKNMLAGIGAHKGKDSLKKTAGEPKKSVQCGSARQKMLHAVRLKDHDSSLKKVDDKDKSHRTGPVADDKDHGHAEEDGHMLKATVKFDMNEGSHASHYSDDEAGAETVETAATETAKTPAEEPASAGAETEAPATAEAPAEDPAPEKAEAPAAEAGAAAADSQS